MQFDDNLGHVVRWFSVCFGDISLFNYGKDFKLTVINLNYNTLNFLKFAGSR